ncbi:hypothetical protein SI65_06195 [Aspergillus cristatus]|uniref:RecF/RecN/SMC N-terminal domain-containing protein n=1 Tax=Aspergillus cristatus TaxID=573508 RepID=A0A1E3BBL1_ASPCR|nr:hypothetical protein SI65_06195 [Aspergillus cristatus]
MSPHLKRSQSSLGSENNDELGDDDTVHAPGSSHSRKRPRTSASPTSEENETSDGDEAASIPEPLSEDEDELELRATQAIQQKYSSSNNEENVPAEHGILERVECYNFMCHDHFAVDLGPLINFIVGKNGSGKSAVLTAITLCLGGKASATNRGQSLKSFIKEGKEHAAIVVRIKNQGDGAYLPDDYGKSIIIERHFTKNGTSGFKIKADNGRIVSNKKAELDSIIDYFTLQFDNPMNVLSQDMARQFLSTSSPAEKYKFFVKGVQLEQLDQDYRLIEESVDQILEKLKSKKQDIGILENRKDVARQRLEISDRHESLRNRIRNIRNQMAWAQVEEQEKIRDALEDELAQTTEHIAAAEAELGRFDDAFREVEGESETAAQFVRRAQSKVEQADNEKEEIKNRSDQHMSERHDLQAQQRQIREYVKAAETSINETQQKIAEETQRLADVSGGSYIRQQEQYEQAQSEANGAKEKYEQLQQDTGRLRQQLEQAGRDAKSAEAPIDKKKADVQQAERLLQNLTKEGGVNHSGYHEKMPMLLRAIQQERSFSRPPVGPIGYHVTLLKQKWSSILETSLGTTLNSFIVTSKRDMNILSGVMQRINCVCPIYIGSDGHIDTSQHEPDADFDTASRVLQIDNDLVRRQLIINHGIEQMLLIERLEEASSVLFDGARPRNVKRCYCIDRRDKRRGIHLSYSRMGEPSQAPVPAYSGSPRMKSDLDSQIRHQREIVEDLRRGLNSQEQEFRLARSRAENCKQALVRHERTIKEQQIVVQRAEDRVEELKEALEKENVGDGSIGILRSALVDAEAGKRLNEGQYNDSVEAMKAMMDTLKETRREMKEKDAQIAALQEELRVAQSEEQMVKEKRRQILGSKNAVIERIDVIKHNQEKIRRQREEVVARVLDYIEKASMVSTRVAVDEGETTHSLDKKLDRLHKDLQRYNRELGASREELAAEASRATVAYERAEKHIRELELLAKIFAETLRYRKDRWGIFRSHISSRAKAQFTYLLSERSFRGRLLADHQGKLLDLQVEPDITKEDGAGRGAKTLSGGEKSFSQVCLLLALWEAMGSPIRCLDEFDVYMDHVNRKMAIDMLMLAARRSIGRQFILITPGSRSDISLAPDVRVKELAEPERGQTTLPFTR